MFTVSVLGTEYLRVNRDVKTDSTYQHVCQFDYVTAIWNPECGINRNIRCQGGYRDG